MTKIQSQTVNFKDFPITLTEKAQEMALMATKAEQDEQMFLRISIKGGGCAGLKYNLDVDNKLTPYDIKTDLKELKIVCDMFSLPFLQNTTIDYEETLSGAGFKFINPKAKRTCGCGSSFT